MFRPSQVSLPPPALIDLTSLPQTLQRCFSPASLWAIPAFFHDKTAQGPRCGAVFDAPVSHPPSLRATAHTIRGEKLPEKRQSSIRIDAKNKVVNNGRIRIAAGKTRIPL